MVSTCVAAPGRTEPIPEQAPNHDLALWTMGLMTGLVGFGVGRTRAALAWVAAQGMAVGVFGSAALFVGVAGTFAPFWTHHNLYFANPLHLGLLGAAVVAWKSPSSLLPERFAMGLAGIGGLGLLMSAMGSFADRNLGLFGLMVPVIVATAATLQHRRKQASEA